jgi:transposase
VQRPGPPAPQRGQLRKERETDSPNQGLLRYLLVAAQVTVRSLPEWRSKFFHLAMRRGRKIAKVAMARKLAVHLYWMWRQGWDYSPLRKPRSHAGEPGNRHGAQ